jgi:hypothetical protein
MHVAVFSTLGSVMVNKHSKLVKRQARDRYGRFSSPSSYTAAPPSHQEEAPSNDSVEMWVVALPPPLCLQLAAPTPPMCLVPPPPPTRLCNSSSASSGYNDECPHVREVSSYEHCF